MEIDLKMSAQDVAILVFHPLCDQRNGKRVKKPSKVVASQSGGTGGDGDDDSEPPGNKGIQHEHSAGSVTIGEDEGKLSTYDAIKRRDALHLPALAAVTTIEVRRNYRDVFGRLAFGALRQWPYLITWHPSKSLIVLSVELQYVVYVLVRGA